MRLQIPAGARPAASFGPWTLYELPLAANGSFLWQPFKLMDTSGAKARWGRSRVFPLGWNPAEGRLRRDHERMRLQAQEPALHGEVEAFLRATYTRAWLLETGGVTAEEIEAEVARLAAARAAREAGGPGGSRRARTR